MNIIKYKSTNLITSESCNHNIHFTLSVSLLLCLTGWLLLFLLLLCLYWVLSQFSVLSFLLLTFSIFLHSPTSMNTSVQTLLVVCLYNWLPVPCFLYLFSFCFSYGLLALFRYSLSTTSLLATFLLVLPSPVVFADAHLQFYWLLKPYLLNPC